MTVELDYELLTTAATRAEELAQKIRTNAASARSASPVALPSLDGIENKATWLEEQATMLYGLADVAVLLDSSGEGKVSMSLAGIQEQLNDMLGEYLGAEFGNIFGNDDDFPLISLATALGKMTKMSRGVAPVFQTGLVGRTMLTKLAQQSGRAGDWARWMLNGPRHLAPPASLLKPPKWVNTPGSPLRNAGWGSPSSFRTSGLGAMRGLGIVGGVVSTGAGVANLVQQGNPIDAFEREGAGYVADVAETAFSASTTAFLVAPNPVTGALAVGSGLVWAGAEVVDHWDEISETASKAWDTISFWD
ncbi:hypothetical protein GL325_12630 [Aeromicrobium sp. 636]|uniref:Uncharacterized protein n=1 Tax=Aeromicrobium senzhongii TaxID=2663859 RepID=A0A8I0EXF7_9ACTN|nr:MULTISPECIES: hypothetical protein [Aeromicrobium]MBC9227171.1 hypothetical protein [Aeromicrobium senzhongii]MCQ3999270.1 hypothetical protein [Aeromicrobium sp. 636]